MKSCHWDYLFSDIKKFLCLDLNLINEFNLRSQNDTNKELTEKVAHLDELNKQLNSDAAENLAELDFMSKDIHAKQKEIKALSDNVKGYFLKNWAMFRSKSDEIIVS